MYSTHSLYSLYLCIRCIRIKMYYYKSKKVFNKYISIYDYIDYKYNLMIIDLRNQLDINIMKVIECLKWWIKKEFIKKKLNSLIINEKENLINKDLIDKNEDLIDEKKDLYE